MLTLWGQNSSHKTDFASQLILGYKNVMCVQFYPVLHIPGCLWLEDPLLRILGPVGFVQGFHEPRRKHCCLLTPGSEVLIISCPGARGINTYLLKLCSLYMCQLKALVPVLFGALAWTSACFSWKSGGLWPRYFVARGSQEERKARRSHLPVSSNCRVHLKMEKRGTMHECTHFTTSGLWRGQNTGGVAPGQELVRSGMLDGSAGRLGTLFHLPCTTFYT